MIITPGPYIGLNFVTRRIVRETRPTYTSCLFTTYSFVDEIPFDFTPLVSIVSPFFVNFQQNLFHHEIYYTLDRHRKTLRWWCAFDGTARRDLSLHRNPLVSDTFIFSVTTDHGGQGYVSNIIRFDCDP